MAGARVDAITQCAQGPPKQRKEWPEGAPATAPALAAGAFPHHAEQMAKSRDEAVDPNPQDRVRLGIRDPIKVDRQRHDGAVATGHQRVVVVAWREGPIPHCLRQPGAQGRVAIDFPLDSLMRRDSVHDEACPREVVFAPPWHPELVQLSPPLVHAQFALQVPAVVPCRMPRRLSQVTAPSACETTLVCPVEQQAHSTSRQHTSKEQVEHELDKFVCCRLLVQLWVVVVV